MPFTEIHCPAGRGGSGVPAQERGQLGVAAEVRPAVGHAAVDGVADGRVGAQVEEAASDRDHLLDAQPLVDAMIGGQRETRVAMPLDDQVVQVLALLSGETVKVESSRINRSGAR